MLNTAIPPRGANALILARFSSDLQNPLSADDQINACIAKCEELGWNVKGTFKDEAKSGRTSANRPGYLTMMATAEAEPVDVIVATSLDRIGRNARELHDVKGRLSDADVAIYTLDRGIMSRIEFAIYAELAQVESEKIADRVSRGHRAAAARGKVMGDVAYGYKTVTDENGTRVEVDPATSSIVLRVNLDYAAGLSPIKIAAALTREGIPTPEGLKVWSPNTILGTRRSGNGLLRNPMYIGRIVFGKTTVTLDSKTGKHIKRKAAEANMVIAAAPWLRILPDELWQEVQDLLAKRAFNWEQRKASEDVDTMVEEGTLREPGLIPPRLNKRPVYLLTGLTKCGMCGGAFALTTTKLGCVNRRVHACDNGRRVVRQDIERVVLDGLRERILQTNMIDSFMSEYLRELEQASKQMVNEDAVRRRRQAVVSREIENLLKQVRAGASVYAAKHLNANLETLALEQERLACESRAGSSTAPAAVSPEAVRKRLRTLLDNLDTALLGDERDAARARDIVRSFISRITVTPIDGDGPPDGRGCGPVRVTVDGSITALLDHTLLNRQIVRSPSNGAAHNPPNGSFRYSVDLLHSLAIDGQGPGNDVEILVRAIEAADTPTRFRDLVTLLSKGDEKDPTATLEGPERRTRITLRHLRENGLIRRVGAGSEASWVWDGHDISDAEWLERLRRPNGLSPVFRDARPITVPQAFVIVDDDDQEVLFSPPAEHLAGAARPRRRAARDLRKLRQRANGVRL
jgi:DNA invertase Pin-like site-specific DNA recombinase